MKEDQITPCSKSIQNHLHVLFGNLEGFIPLRSFSSDGDKCNRWIKADEYAPTKAFQFAKEAATQGRDFFIIPGTVKNKGQAKADDVQQIQSLLIDIDEGNTENKLSLLSDYLGSPTLIVESGGITQENLPKLHIYWQLDKPVCGGELKPLLELRHKIALYAGGDLHFKSAHQPIRMAGSIYLKKEERKLVKIRKYEPWEYSLDELKISVKKLEEEEGSGQYSLTKSNQSSTSKPFEKVLTSKVYAGGSGENTRFNHITRVAGFWIRRAHDGVLSREAAIEEISSYNFANVVPAWPEEKLLETIDGLWDRHTKKYGQPKELKNQFTQLETTNPSNWQGAPPEREWVIQGWLPRAAVTALYGDGGIGKSLIAQQLMTAIATGNKFLEIQTAKGKCYALMCEDEKNELWRRQMKINTHYNLRMQELGELHYVSRVGMDNQLVSFDASNRSKLTKFFNELYNSILALRPILVVLDTVADLYGGNENSRIQVREFIQTVCGRIARDANCAVLLCAHPSEAGMQKGTGTSGSTAWNNTVRSRWYLKQKTSEDNTIILSREKSNYSRSGEKIELCWKEGVFVTNTQNVSIYEQKSKKLESIVATIGQEAKEGRIYTINQFAKSFNNEEYDFGSERNIRRILTSACKEGKVRFFLDPAPYGINYKRSSYGYLCVNNMKIKSDSGEFKDAIATHRKCKNNRSLTAWRKGL